MPWMTSLEGMGWIKPAYILFLCVTFAFVALKAYTIWSSMNAAMASADGFRARQRARMRGNWQIAKWICLFLLIHWPLLRFMGALSKMP
jgi:hypothetical protein